MGLFGPVYLITFLCQFNDIPVFCIYSEICGVSGFQRGNQVEKHMIFDHTERGANGAFKCFYKDCNVELPTYSWFRSHLRVHRGEENVKALIMQYTILALQFRAH